MKEDTMKFSSDDLELLEKIPKFTPPFCKTKEMAWEEISNHIEEEKIILNSSKRYYYIISMAVAASILIFFSIWFFYPTKSSSTIIASTNTLKNIDLPDKSQVVLNNTSKIELVEFSEQKRKVILLGEAFFTVTQGPEYIVECGNNSILVLGTEFNVFYRDSIFKVECFSGNVKVTFANGSSELLSKGELISNEKTDSFLKSTKTDTIASPRWIKGEFNYNAELLENVFDEIERQYGKKIEYQSKNKRFYTGYFRKSNLQETLEIVCIPMGLKYSVQGDTVKILE